MVSPKSASGVPQSRLDAEEELGAGLVATQIPRHASDRLLPHVPEQGEGFKIEPGVFHHALGEAVGTSGALVEHVQQQVAEGTESRPGMQEGAADEPQVLLVDEAYVAAAEPLVGLEHLAVAGVTGHTGAVAPERPTAEVLCGTSWTALRHRQHGDQAIVVGDSPRHGGGPLSRVLEAFVGRHQRRWLRAEDTGLQGTHHLQLLLIGRQHRAVGTRFTQQVRGLVEEFLVNPFQGLHVQKVRLDARGAAQAAQSHVAPEGPRNILDRQSQQGKQG